MFAYLANAARSRRIRSGETEAFPMPEEGEGDNGAEETDRVSEHCEKF